MKTALPIVLLGLLAGSVESADYNEQLPPPPANKSWKLVWQDEFDGDKLDATKWEVPDQFLVDYVRVYDLVDAK